MSDALRRLTDELGWSLREPEPGFFVAERCETSVFGNERTVRERMQKRLPEGQYEHLTKGNEAHGK